MKKILVMSDTHGRKALMAGALARCGDADMCVHLGDYSQDALALRGMTNKPVWAVRGNCDLTHDVPEELGIIVEDVTIALVHGHRHGVKHSLLRLGLYALEKDAKLVLFGHTHMPNEEFYEGAILYNPGSLGEPRGGKPTYGVVTVDGGAFRIKTYTL